MSDHTKEPWALNRHGAIIGGPVIEYTNGSAQSQLAMTVGADWMKEGETYANARRIVACVNACAGIPTNKIEGKTIVEYVRPSKPEPVNQKMLEALKELRDAYQEFMGLPACNANAAIAAAEAAQSASAQQQGEPVAWQFLSDGKWWNGDDRIKNHRKNTEEAGYPVRDLYAAPAAPACSVPDVLSKRRYMMSESHLSGYRLILGFERMEDMDAAQVTLAAATKPEGGA